ncbi:hypothetical protein AAVH_24434 [Aphelenchoides avenae]|nr:hypothetical protein AAVH_24434 [Aphelenchus avenae]
MFQWFFRSFNELAEKEQAVHSWLLGARLRNRFDYVGQLTALMHDALVAINKLQRILDSPRTADHAHEVVWRLGLMDKRFASANLTHKGGDLSADYRDLALLCHLIGGHIAEIILQLPRRDYEWIDESLKADAAGIRHWVSERWHRTGMGSVLPCNADYVEPWVYQSYYESWPTI